MLYELKLETLANRVAVTDLRPLLPGPRALQQRFARLLEQIAFRGLLCPGKVDHLDRLIGPRSLTLTTTTRRG